MKQLVIVLLVLTLIPWVKFVQAQSEQVIKVTDDAYSIADLNDQADKMGLREVKTGKLPFLKVWYAWNVTSAEEMKIISVAYVKFDLKNVNSNNLESAMLRLYAQNVTVTGQPRFVNLYLADSAEWDESDITFLTSPEFSNQSISRIPILSSDAWYEWNVTSVVKDKAGSEITFAILLETLLVNSEEQIVFVSKDSDNEELRPALVIEPSTLPQVATTTSSILNPGIVGGMAAIIAVGVGAYVIYTWKIKRTYSGKFANGNNSDRASLKDTGLLCPKCTKSVSDQFNLCPYCNYDLEDGIACANCKKKISKDYKLCPYCGSRFKP